MDYYIMPLFSKKVAQKTSAYEKSPKMETPSLKSRNLSQRKDIGTRKAGSSGLSVFSISETEIFLMPRIYPFVKIR